MDYQHFNTEVKTVSSPTSIYWQHKEISPFFFLLSFDNKIKTGSCYVFSLCQDNFPETKQKKQMSIHSVNVAPFIIHSSENIQ